MVIKNNKREIEEEIEKKRIDKEVILDCLKGRKGRMTRNDMADLINEFIEEDRRFQYEKEIKFFEFLLKEINKPRKCWCSETKYGFNIAVKRFQIKIDKLAGSELK